MVAAPTAKVTDFGIAQVREGAASMTRTGMMMGTWAYMAPEQKQSAKDVDARSDVYAAAATLYALVSGNEPFDLYASEVQEEVSERLPPALVDVVRRGTRFRPEDRWPSAAAMLQALRAIQATLPEDPPETPKLGGHLLPPMDPGLGSAEGTIDLDADPPPTEKGAPVRLATPTRVEPDTTPGPTNVGPKGERTVESAKPAAVAPVRQRSPVLPLVLVGVVVVLVAFGVSVKYGFSEAEVPAPAAIVAPAPAHDPVPTAPIEATTPAEPVPEPIVQGAVGGTPTAAARPAAPVPESAKKPVAAAKVEPVVAASPEEPVVVAVEPPRPVAVVKAAQGRLFVNSIPWSYVTVDGRGEARTGWSGDLPEGEHTLKFRTEAGLERTLKVQVTAPETRFCWKLVEDVPC